MRPRIAQLNELRLADIVELNDQPDGSGAWRGYNAATVENIDNEWVHLLRPYVHTGDFSHTGGVSTYIGFEQVKLPVSDLFRQVILIQRKELK